MSSNNSFIIKGDRSVWSAGKNDKGQLGDGTKTDTYDWKRVFENAKFVVHHVDFTMVLKNDGTLWACGSGGNGTVNNIYSVFGDGTTSVKTQWQQVLSDVKRVAVGNAHALALKNDGTLWGTGYNTQGQLGDGTTSHALYWKQLLTEVKQIACGMYHSLVLREDDSLWVAGYNGYGQFGNNSTANIPTWKKMAEGIEHISAGSRNSLIIKKDKKLYGAGHNASGQLGLNDKANRLQWTLLLEDVKQTSAGPSHTMAIKNDGTLWACGLNVSGQLGDGTTNDSLIWKLVENNIKQVRCGDNHTMVIKNDGTLWACGLNVSGQLGVNTNYGLNTANSNFFQVVSDVSLLSNLTLTDVILRLTKESEWNLEFGVVPLGLYSRIIEIPIQNDLATSVFKMEIFGEAPNSLDKLEFSIYKKPFIPYAKVELLGETTPGQIRKVYARIKTDRFSEVGVHVAKIKARVIS